MWLTQKLLYLKKISTKLKGKVGMTDTEKQRVAYTEYLIVFVHSIKRKNKDLY